MLEKRIVKIGEIKCGTRNNICDVKGVLVGHSTVESDNVHTGITAILPHNGNMFKEKVVASSYSFKVLVSKIGVSTVPSSST